LTPTNSSSPLLSSPLLSHPLLFFQAPLEHLHPNLVSAPTQLVTTSFKWVNADPKWKAGANRIKKLTVDSYKLIRHPYGWAPLHEAASYGQTAAAKVLMDAGASVNIVDDMGRTPLHMACANGTPDLIAALAAHGADPNMRDCHGCVPLMYAVKGTQEPAVEKLLEMYGEALELDAEEEIYGLTALHMAAKYGLDELCFLLLEAGADQNTPDLRRCTPLHYAVSGAVIGLVSDTPPELAMDIRNAAFGMHSKQVADQWVKQWEDGEVHRRGLSEKRLNELREEVKVKNGRYVDTTQVAPPALSLFSLSFTSLPLSQPPFLLVSSLFLFLFLFLLLLLSLSLFLSLSLYFSIIPSLSSSFSFSLTSSFPISLSLSLSLSLSFSFLFYYSFFFIIFSSSSSSLFNQR
jgi:hypothetical protein